MTYDISQNKRLNQSPIKMTKTNRSFVSLGFLALLGTTACGLQSPTNSATVESVEIPQTAIENQGRLGICWAYATTGLIESQYKANTKKSINLSEESIALFHMAHALHKMFQTIGTVDLWKATAADKLPEGWFLRMSDLTRPENATEDDMDALDLIKRYGVWPESVWNAKADTSEKRDTMRRQISERARAFIRDGKQYDATVEQIIEEIVVGPGLFSSRPPATFVYEGRQYTPQEFLKSLSFDPDDFVAVEAQSESDYRKVISATKRTLARGMSVPLGFPINISRLQNDTFSGKGIVSQSLGDLVNFTRDGGHLVLVTDFVNTGSTEGSIPMPELQEELDREEYSLDYLVFKNSWGVGAKNNEAGIPVGGSASGYYKIDREYLLASAKVGAYRGWAPLTVVVPKGDATAP
jgi:hypothetical protein